MKAIGVTTFGGPDLLVTMALTGPLLLSLGGWVVTMNKYFHNHDAIQ